MPAWSRLTIERSRIDPDYDDGGLAISESNRATRELFAELMRAQLGGDAELEAKVIPDYPATAKRMLQDNGSWLACLRKMYQLVPKHKASEKLQADLKTKMKELNEEVEKERKSGKKGGRIAEMYRHEFGSLLDVANQPEFVALADLDMKDLLLHLIAAHHGPARAWYNGAPSHRVRYFYRATSHFGSSTNFDGCALAA